ncbi:MerR family transcriptional regulator [Flavitalea antarctica]
MESYSVSQLSALSGVSVRTLHHYDEIGLLKPSGRSTAGYRHYGQHELLRLQQILFYKELNFSLREICEVLDDPDFDVIQALQFHRQKIEENKNRLDQLITTIDNTIVNLKKQNVMTDPKILYEGLPKEFATTYRNNAMDEYGEHVVLRSESALLKLGKQGLESLKAEAERVTTELFARRSGNPLSPDVQSLIADHYVIIRKFWGTQSMPDKQADAYVGLGELYINDERFTMANGSPQPEFARFMQKAMQFFAETSLR